MLLDIVIAVIMLVVTTAIHAGGMVLAMHLTRTNKKAPLWRERLQRLRIYWVAGIVLLMFLASLAEVWIWALTFLLLDAIQGLEQALYFSMVTFTTLGYGDIVLDERWRLLASFEAANGIIMFGWTTAIVLAVVQRVYLSGDAKPLGSAESVP